MIKKDALWVISDKNYGSYVDSKEKRLNLQAERIVKFVEQLDLAQEFLNENNFDLIKLTR